MKINKLNLIQNNEKLVIGFEILSSNKFSMINGGIAVNEI